MCYLIAKDFNKISSYTLQTKYGQQLVDLKNGYNNIQLVTINRPSAYGEYEPYHFTTSEQDFEEKFYAICKNSKI
ncbi:DUF6718 family protein [Megamonas hypermegale]|uniref:DUF6718 family protein n=1 Tax=Megamonas hypermegale TaxID=158847 RepID=UPI0026E93338|nr:DUF6718 family protein [Megamonas hypermegale]